MRTRYYNLELPHDLLAFNENDPDLFRMLTDDLDVVFIDEFHYLPNAFKIFKAVYDGGAKTKIVATGSASTEMHKHLKESLAGRRLAIRLMPLSFAEYSQTGMDRQVLLVGHLTFGGLPGLIHHDAPEIDFVLLKNRRPFLIEVKTTLRAPEIPPAMKIFMKHYPETAGGIVYSTDLNANVAHFGKRVAFRRLESLARDDTDAWW